jgi:AraC-like DNA-binding protein
MELGRSGHGLVVYPPGATFGPRVLHDFEFVWILNGEVTYEADGQAHACPPGSLVLGRPGTRESYRWDARRQTRHAYVHFQLGPADLAGLPPLTSWPRVRTLPEGDVARPLFRHLIWLLDEERTEWAPLIGGAVLHLLRCFVSGALHSRSEGRLELPVPVEKALRVVQAQWAQGRLVSPPLATLARAAGVSQVHLCRLFRQALGHGPIAALRMLRLDRAAALLERSNLQVQEIAELTGFDNPFHFSRSFRELYGVSPRAYRGRLVAGETVLPRELLQLRRVAGQVAPEA